MIKEYDTITIIARDVVLNSNFNVIKGIPEEMQAELQNQARMDAYNLPGEFLFRLEYYIFAETLEDEDQAADLQVEPDDPWDYVACKGRLIVDNE